MPLSITLSIVLMKPVLEYWTLTTRMALAAAVFSIMYRNFLFFNIALYVLGNSVVPARVEVHDTPRMCVI